MPSKVDISSLEQLVAYSMYDLSELKERIATLEDVEGIEKFYSHEYPRTWVSASQKFIQDGACDIPPKTWKPQYPVVTLLKQIAISSKTK